MTRLTQFKKGLIAFLVMLTAWLGVTFSLANPAQAKPKALDATSYFDQRGNSVDAYRNLQRATYAYRNEGFEGEGSQTGRIGNRRELARRTGAKLQDRMDNRRDLTNQPNSVEDAAENMMDNTKGAFRRAAGKVQKNLNLND
jgi:hypothetical protein